MRLRSASSDDLPALAQIMHHANARQAAWMPAKWQPPSQQQNQVSLAERMSDSHLTVAEDTQLRGFVCWRNSRRTPGAADLSLLFVAPSEQRQGVGSRLHDSALGQMRERGFTVAELWVAEENPARAFYRFHNWYETELSRQHPLLQVRMLRMERSL